MTEPVPPVAPQTLGSVSGSVDIDLLGAVVAKRLQEGNGRPWWRKQMDAWGQPTIIIALLGGAFYGVTGGRAAYEQIWKNRDALEAIADPKNGLRAELRAQTENVRQEASAKLEIVSADVDKATRRVEQLEAFRSYIEGDVKARRAMVDERMKAIDQQLRPIETMLGDIRRLQQAVDGIQSLYTAGRAERLGDRDKDRERTNDALSDVRTKLAVLESRLEALTRGAPPFPGRNQGWIVPDYPPLFNVRARLVGARSLRVAEGM